MSAFFDPSNNWWVSKVTKKGLHKSTVMSVAFHPKDNTLLLTGCADFKCRYFSSFIKLVDKKEQKKGELGTIFGEWGSKGWVLSCGFSPDGNTIAFAGHDSTITFSQTDKPESASVVYYKGLPFNSIVFLSNNALVAAGYDNSPHLFANKSGQWQYVGDCDGDGDAPSKPTQSSGVSKFGASKFGGAKTTTESSSTETKTVDTKHKFPITELKVYESDSNGIVSKFSSCALDGRILVWDVKEVQKKFSDVKF